MDEVLVAEVRQLLMDVQEVGRDSRLLADRYAELLKGVVAGYSEALDQRAEALLQRLEGAA